MRGQFYLNAPGVVSTSGRLFFGFVRRRLHGRQLLAPRGAHEAPGASGRKSRGVGQARDKPGEEALAIKTTPTYETHGDATPNVRHNERLRANKWLVLCGVSVKWQKGLRS